MMVALQILNAILIFIAGVLLAPRIYPALFASSEVTGHDYIKNLEDISRQLSEKQLCNEDVEFVKQMTVKAITLISESLVDSKVMASDTRSRTRSGLILLAVGTFIQSLMLVFVH
jgi:hypothetical protein